MMILGQAKIFCSRAVIRFLGWEVVDAARISAVQAMVDEHTRAICRALKGPA
jgi:hypothetical protein